MTISHISPIRPPINQQAPRSQPGGLKLSGFSLYFGIGHAPRIPDGAGVGGITNLLTLQRKISDYALRVEIVSKVAEALSGSIRKLTQG